MIEAEADRRQEKGASEASRRFYCAKGREEGVAKLWRRTEQTHKRRID